MTSSKTSLSYLQSASVDAEEFGVVPFDYSADLCGDPCKSQLNLFMNGNQYMVMPDLIAAFGKAHLEISEVFYETLPPGVLINQLKKTRLKMGELTISVVPDLIAAGPQQLAKLQDENLVRSFVKYASNDLAMIVKKGNPQQVNTFEDLLKPTVRVALPNPATEGVGRLILDAFESFGGKAFKDKIAQEKVDKKEAFFTQIHHRQSPLWLEQGKVDLALLWSTEATHLIGKGKDFERLPVAPEHNQTGHYAIGQLNNAGHFQTATEFMEFITSSTAQDIYRSYGFGPPQ